MYTFPRRATAAAATPHSFIIRRIRRRCHRNYIECGDNTALPLVLQAKDTFPDKDEHVSFFEESRQ